MEMPLTGVRPCPGRCGPAAAVPVSAGRRGRALVCATLASANALKADDAFAVLGNTSKGVWVARVTDAYPITNKSPVPVLVVDYGLSNGGNRRVERPDGKETSFTLEPNEAVSLRLKNPPKEAKKAVVIGLEVVDSKGGVAGMLCFWWSSVNLGSGPMVATKPYAFIQPRQVDDVSKAVFKSSNKEQIMQIVADCTPATPTGGSPAPGQ